jgi:hypothetical protein
MFLQRGSRLICNHCLTALRLPLSWFRLEGVSTVQHVRPSAPFMNAKIRHHSVKVHGHNTRPTEVQKNACYLQGWIKRRVVQSTRYWIVDTSVESSPCCPHNHDQSSSPQQDAEAELLELEAEEEDRLCRDPEIVIHDDLETDEDSEWLRACNWATWFKHKPIPLLITATMVS